MGAGASVDAARSVLDAESTVVRGSAGSYFIEMGKCVEVDQEVEVSNADAAVVALPRGGVLVNYSKGTVQFGLPPETIKDAMLWGLTVPSTFVIMGEEMFDRQLGINIAEFEFPAYFNYFVFGKRVTLITTAAVEQRVRSIFQETLLGPKVGSYDLSQDFSSKLPGGELSKQNPDTHWPDFVLEGLALDRQRATISVDALLRFENLDRRREITLSSQVRAKADKRKKEKRKKLRKGKTAANLAHLTGDDSDTDDEASANGPVRPGETGKVMLCEETGCYVKWNPTHKKYLVREGKRTIAQVDYRFRKPRHKPRRKVTHEPFDVPLFGVTMLGTSHGFDPKGTTTGFVVWVNRRGIMVDPPPDSAEVLRDMAIPTRLIDGMILTHCHADHDAGAFQKILAESSIKIYTTQTIMESFIRKYSAISNLDANFLRGLFIFRRVKSGERLTIHGGRFDFFYSLHVIPTIGFEVKFAGEGIIYSGDTCTNFKLFEKMYREKKIGKGRLEDLLKRSPVSRHRPAGKKPDGSPRRAYQPHILHEAGVPPIHTPLEMLAKLPSDTRSRLFVVHVDNKLLQDPKIAKKLKTIPQWSTLRIDVDLACVAPEGAGGLGASSSLSPVLDVNTNSVAALLSTVPFFKHLNAPQKIDELLLIGSSRFYPKGAVIRMPGDLWNTSFLVRAGVALEVSHESDHATGKKKKKTQDQEPAADKAGPVEGTATLDAAAAAAAAAAAGGTPGGTEAGDGSDGAGGNNGTDGTDAADGADGAEAAEDLPKVLHKPTFYYVGDFFGEQSLLADERPVTDDAGEQEQGREEEAKDKNAPAKEQQSEQGQDNGQGQSGQPGQDKESEQDTRTASSVAANVVQHQVVAYTNLYTVEFKGPAMLEFLKSSEIGRTVLSNISAVAKARSLETWNVIRFNDTLNRIMNRTQQQEFQKLLSLRKKVAKHETIFAGGQKQTSMFLIASGCVNLFAKMSVPAEAAAAAGASAAAASGPSSPGSALPDAAADATAPGDPYGVQDESEHEDLGPGTLVGDVSCLQNNTIARYTLTAKTECTLYEVPRIGILNFWNRFPGIKLQCIDRRYIC